MKTWTKTLVTTAGFLSLLGFSLVLSRSQGTLLWDESVNGPLSNDYTQPTSFGLLQFGTNSLLGATEYVSFGNNGALYEDCFTFTIPSTARVDSLFLSVDKPVLIWIGDAAFSQPLSYAFNPSSGSLLSQLSLPFITSGTYGMYIKMNDFSMTDAAHYRMDFFQNVPEPGTISLALVGLGLFALRFRKIRNGPQ